MDLSLFQPAPAPPTAAGFKPPGTLPGRITGLGEIFADFYYILQGVGVNQENSFGADNLTLGKKSGNRPPGPPGRFWGPEGAKNWPAFNKTDLGTILR
jgi:hypothetical protein